MTTKTDRYLVAAEGLTEHYKNRHPGVLCSACDEVWPCGVVEVVAEGLAKRDQEVAEQAVWTAAHMYPATTRDMVSRGSVRKWLTDNAGQVAAASVAQPDPL